MSNFTQNLSAVQSARMGMDAHSDKLFLLFRDFRAFHDSLIQGYNVFSVVLVTAGFLGSLLGLAIMLFTGSMRTPSFAYHKSLVAADFAFCANWLLLQIIDPKVDSGSLSEQFHFQNAFAAYYSGVVSRVVASTSGYMNLYVTLWVALDRFLALHKPVFYYGFNRPIVCRSAIFFGFILSLLLHSWSPWFERSLSVRVRGNQTFYVWQDVLPTRTMAKLLKAKETYNSVLRICFPIVLSFLTFVAIWHFVQIDKKRREICLSRRYSGRQRRRDKFLFILMISVVVLAFIQVLPREALRLLEFIYPSTYLRSQVLNKSLDIQDRMWYFRVQLYGHEVLKILMNACTAINRCLLFYLYLGFNRTFRKALVRCVKRLLRLPISPELSLFATEGARRKLGVTSTRGNRSTYETGVCRTPLIEVQNCDEENQAPGNLHLTPWNFVRRLNAAQTGTEDQHKISQCSLLKVDSHETVELSAIVSNSTSVSSF